MRHSPKRSYVALCLWDFNPNGLVAEANETFTQLVLHMSCRWDFNPNGITSNVHDFVPCFAHFIISHIHRGIIHMHHITSNISHVIFKHIMKSINLITIPRFLISYFKTHKSSSKSYLNII